MPQPDSAALNHISLTSAAGALAALRWAVVSVASLAMFAASATALAALAMPAPQFVALHVAPAGKGLAVACKIARISVAVSAGFAANMSETMPATTGAEKLVP